MQNAPLLALFAHEGYEEMVALLLEFGSDVNCRNADGITPLMFACQKGNPEVARTLVQHHQVKILNREVDSNRTCQSTKESTSAQLFVYIFCKLEIFACQKGNPEVARTLVQHHQVKILKR